MTAPEVRITATDTATAHGPEWTAYDVECGGCGKTFSHWRESDAHEWAQRHEETCAPLQLARLQARWDARDEAERALITEWRRRVDERLQLAAESGDPDQYDGFVSGMTTAADELERAIGGGE